MPNLLDSPPSVFLVSILVLDIGACQSLPTPRKYHLFSVKGVARPSQSRCQEKCSETNRALAVPASRAEYQCMVATASTIPEALSRRSTSFWTGLAIAGDNMLTGIVNGTNYTGILWFWGPHAFQQLSSR